MLGLGQGDSKAPPAPPRDAATVILLRPADTTWRRNLGLLRGDGHG